MRHRRSGPAAPGDRAPQPAVRHHDHGQGHDRRGPSALARLHRALLPADAAQAPALGRPDRRARLRHRRGRVRGLDRRRAAAADRHRAGRRRALGQARAPGDRRSRRLAGAACRRCPPRTNAWTRAGARRAPPRVPARAAAREPTPSPPTRRSTRCAARCRATALLVFDVGAHTHQIASQWTAHAPKTFHITNGWSSMGFGLPGAIAAKLARPDLPVVCLIGDGCFQMTCGEVAVAKRLGLTLPDRRARRQLARADQGEADPPPVPALRHRAAGRGLSRAAGALFRRAGGRRRAAPRRWKRRCKKALAAKGPTVIEAVVDSDHYLETVYD